MDIKPKKLNRVCCSYFYWMGGAGESPRVWSIVPRVKTTFPGSGALPGFGAVPRVWSEFGHNSDLLKSPKNVKTLASYNIKHLIAFFLFK